MEKIGGKSFQIGPGRTDPIEDFQGRTEVPGKEGAGLAVTCGEEQKLAVLRRGTAAGGRVTDLDMAPPSLADIYTHFGLAGEAPANA